MRDGCDTPGTKHWAQRDDTEMGRNGETAIKGQRTDDRRQMLQNAEYRTAEQGIAE
jgi:hypothetical protein